MVTTKRPHPGRRCPARGEITRYSAVFRFRPTTPALAFSRSGQRSSLVGITRTFPSLCGCVMPTRANTDSSMVEWIRLEDGLVRLMRLRHLSYRTEQSYVGWFRWFRDFSGDRHGVESPARSNRSACSQSKRRQPSASLTTRSGPAKASLRSAFTPGRKPSASPPACSAAQLPHFVREITPPFPSASPRRGSRRTPPPTACSQPRWPRRSPRRTASGQVRSSRAARPSPWRGRRT